MAESIRIIATLDEIHDFLDDMAERNVPDDDTQGNTDELIHRIRAAFRAAKAGTPVVPMLCEEAPRKRCYERARWRVRRAGDTTARNWAWVCDRHLSTVCKFHGEDAELDVVRVGV